MHTERYIVHARRVGSHSYVVAAAAGCGMRLNSWARPRTLLLAMLDDAARTIVNFVSTTFTGSINRFQKLKWLGKIVVIALLLSYIALAVTFFVIGPDTVFQVGLHA